MTISAFAAAALLFGTAALEPAPIPAPTAPAERPIVQTIDPSTDMRRVCVVDTRTGTRLTRRYCQSRAQWVAQGTDPLAGR